MAKEKRIGSLVIVGGHEDREGEKRILKEVARRITNGKIVIMTVASHDPDGYFEQYDRAFRDLGLDDVRELYIHDRKEALTDEAVRKLDDVEGVFFSGGDQLRITSQIGDTPITRRIQEIFRHGGVIGGTSAGASVMCETMLVRGTSRESHRIGDLHLAAGLGLIHDVIIDQHFAERGRMGRLLGCVAQNPRMLGIGIDEDTGIVVEGTDFGVIGSGAVYVVDGEGVTSSNIAEEKDDRTLSLYDVRLHVLSAGDRFELTKRRPHLGPVPGS